MSVESLVVFLLVGAISGWLAGNIMRGGGFGLIGNIVVGIIGAYVGGNLLGWLGVSVNLGGALISSIITAVVGAVVLLFVIGLFKK